LLIFLYLNVAMALIPIRPDAFNVKNFIEIKRILASTAC